jgi:hypothetical protein
MTLALALATQACEAARFQDNDDGTVLDWVKGLAWQKEVSGELTWDEASAYCDALDLGGHSDWRLPESSNFCDSTCAWEWSIFPDPDGDTSSESYDAHVMWAAEQCCEAYGGGDFGASFEASVSGLDGTKNRPRVERHRARCVRDNTEEEQPGGYYPDRE